MYKILVADDENLIVKGIISKLDYYKFEFDEIYEAGDGRQALEIIKTRKPDIVITDIRMPHLDGIQLIRSAKEMGAETKFIIISGHAEFEYAEQALNMGVSGYMLKPICDKDFVDTLNKVIKIIDNENMYKEASSKKEELEKYCEILTIEQKLNQVVHTVKYDNEEDKDEDLKKVLGLDENSKYVLGLVNIDGKTYQYSTFKYQDIDLIKFSIINIINEIECKFNKIVFNNYKDKNQLFVLISSQNGSELKLYADGFFAKAYHSITKYLNIIITIGISKIEDNLSYELYRQAKEAFDQRLIYNSSELYKYSNIPSSLSLSLPQNEIRLLQKYIERSDVGNIEIILKDIFSEKNLKNSSTAYIRMIWMEIINMMVRVGSELKHEINVDFDTSLFNEEILSKFDSVDEIVSYLYTTIIDFMKLEKVTDLNCKNKIKMAVQYIEQHYQEELTVNDIAYMFAMSPNYFSTVFRKELGKTVVNYITDVRIKNACRMLTETKASIVDISREVGYQDTQYFFRVFKKIMGKTPLEYRKGE